MPQELDLIPAEEVELDLTPAEESKGFLQALGETLAPSEESIQRVGAGIQNPVANPAGMLLTEVLGNVASLPARFTFSGLRSATTDEGFNEALANKTEAARAFGGDEFVQEHPFLALFADVALDPANLAGGTGFVKATSKARRGTSLLDDVIRKEPIAQSKVPNLLEEAATPKQAQARIDEFIAGKSEKEVASPFNTKDDNPLKDLIDEAKRDLDPVKVGESQTVKKAPGLVRNVQDEVAAARGERMNVEEVQETARMMVNTMSDAELDKFLARSGEGPLGIAVRGERVAHNIDRVIRKAANDGLDDVLAEHLVGLKKAGQTLKITGPVQDKLIRTVRNYIKQIDDPAMRKQMADFFVEHGLGKKKEIKPGFWKKFVEWSTMIKLTGVSTQVKAVAGNTSALLLRLPEKLTEAAVDALVFGATGQRSIRAGEALAEFKAGTAGLKNAWRKGWNALSDETVAAQEQSKFNELFTQAGAIEGPRLNLDLLGVKINDVGELVRMPGRLLGAEDVFFKSLSYDMEIAAQATRRAYGEGLRGAELEKRVADLIRNPSPDMIEKARFSARERVFQEELEGRISQGVNLMRRNPFVRLITPFYNTPVNLLKQGAQRSPLTFALPSTWKKVRKMTRTQAREILKGRGAEPTKAAVDDLIRVNQQQNVSEVLGRAVSGSLFMTGAWYMGMEGKLSGRGPKSKAKRNTLRATGWQPYSMKFGDTFISYQGFEPISSWLRLAGDVADGVKNKSSFEETASQAGLSYIRQFLENPFLMGVHDVMNADRELEAGDVPRVFSNLAVGSTLPVILQQWGTRVYDPIVRKPIAGGLKGFAEEIQARTPFGASEGVAPLRDIFGQPVKRHSPVWQAFGVTLSVDKNDPVVKELVNNDISIGRPSRNLGGTELSESEYERYAALTGLATKEALSRIVRAPGYSGLSKEMKQRLLRSTIQQARNRVRQTEFQKYYR